MDGLTSCVSSTQSPNKEPKGPISADQTKPSNRTVGSFLVPKTYRDPQLVQGSSGERKPACAKEHDPPDGEFLVHATDMNSLVSIFKTGLCPASLQKEKARHLADMRPAVESAGKRTTVQFTAISNCKRQFMVRNKKPLLLVFSATAIAANFETWVFDDNPIVATPQMIRPDLILGVLTANHVIYEDEACPPFVVKKIAFWWDGYLKEKDLRTYSDGQAAAASFNAPPEPASPLATSKETKYRPTKQRRQNKMPPEGKPKAYRECPEPGTTCPYCSEITDLHCRKCGDTARSDCRTTDPDTACRCHKTHICSVDKDKRPICLRPEPSIFTVGCRLKRSRHTLTQSPPGATTRSRR